MGKKPQIFSWNNRHPLKTSRCRPPPESCKAGCWAGAGPGCGSRGRHHPQHSPLAPQEEWSRPRSLDQGQADPAAVVPKPQARQRRHGSEQERGTAGRAGEGRSQNAAMQLRGWALLPNPGGAGVWVTVWARHAYTSNPSQRISCLSVETC